MINNSYKQISIPDGGTTSNELEINNHPICGMIIDSTTWTNANITLLGTIDNVHWVDIYDAAGDKYKIAAAAGARLILLDEDAFKIPSKIKLVSSATQSPTQTIKVIFS